MTCNAGSSVAWLTCNAGLTCAVIFTIGSQMYSVKGAVARGPCFRFSPLRNTVRFPPTPPKFLSSLLLSCGDFGYESHSLSLVLAESVSEGSQNFHIEMNAEGGCQESIRGLMKKKLR
jgi:hypothetical protein